MKHFEDFPVGTRIRHLQGRTLGHEHRFFTSLCMNGVQLHFNQDFCEKDDVVRESFQGRIVVYGGYILTLVRGLASPDIGEFATREVGFTNGRHLKPCFEGDTIYAESEVVEAGESHLDAKLGRLKLRLVGKNQKDETILEIDQILDLPRRG